MVGRQEVGKAKKEGTTPGGVVFSFAFRGAIYDCGYASWC